MLLDWDYTKFVMMGRQDYILVPKENCTDFMTLNA